MTEQESFLELVAKIFEPLESNGTDGANNANKFNNVEEFKSDLDKKVLIVEQMFKGYVIKFEVSDETKHHLSDEVTDVTNKYIQSFENINKA